MAAEVDRGEKSIPAEVELESQGYVVRALQLSNITLIIPTASTLLHDPCHGNHDFKT